MITIKIYSHDNKAEWDELVKKSKNGTFLLFRDYIDYHSYRFNETSFLFFRKTKLEAVMPGNIVDRTYYSHQGLTYGGLIYTNNLSVCEILEIFNLINQELKEKGIKTVIYKAIPYIYHSQPADEDIYALFRLKAVKIGCNISSTIFQNNKIKFIESRKSGIRKAIQNKISVAESSAFEEFWNILNENLTQKFQKKPVHTIEEILLLKSRFPQNIKLYTATENETTIAGTILYIMENTIHVQYISANFIGKTVGALDLIFDFLINKEYINIQYFDFGQSTEEMGNILNENLIFQKEGFGGRGLVYDIYEYNI